MRLYKVVISVFMLIILLSIFTAPFVYEVAIGNARPLSATLTVWYFVVIVELIVHLRNKMKEIEKETKMEFQEINNSLNDQLAS